MTQAIGRLRTVHRILALLTVLVVAVALTLNLLGVLSGRQALLVFLGFEVPALILFVGATVVRFGLMRRRSLPHISALDTNTLDTNVLGGARLLDAVVAEEPLLRPVVTELRALWGLWLFITKQPQVPLGAEAFGYTRGTLGIPVAMIVVSVVELAVVHLLVPWRWLQLLLLVLTIWAVLFMLGIFAARAVHPHVVTEEDLYLRWGDRLVLTSPLSNVLSAEAVADHSPTQPAVTGEKLLLTQFHSTNVRIRFAEPVAADPPVSAKATPAGFRAREVALYVVRPNDFVAACTRETAA
ncbi:hypothetical protein [Leucobacter sp. G161]|uniref:hypothetical protein n=1 Tax=Leucobacter sp. G161 TaxID=663704 RepID=UPI00073C7D1C|nr:hypothetical protein [Leucobacter sp. G161]KUF06356.1 hypothetical protein AUL38_02640 [Leucobacter sp. G161]